MKNHYDRNVMYQHIYNHFCIQLFLDLNSLQLFYTSVVFLLWSLPCLALAIAIKFSMVSSQHVFAWQHTMSI